MKRLCFLILIILSFNVYSQDVKIQRISDIDQSKFDKIDYALSISYVLLNAYDLSLTEYALRKSNNLYEANPIYGKNPSFTKLLIGKVFTTSATIYISTKLSRRGRKIFLTGANLAYMGICIWNTKQINLSVNF